MPPAFREEARVEATVLTQVNTGRRLRLRARGVFRFWLFPGSRANQITKGLEMHMREREGKTTLRVWGRCLRQGRGKRGRLGQREGRRAGLAEARGDMDKPGTLQLTLLVGPRAPAKVLTGVR